MANTMSRSASWRPTNSCCCKSVVFSWMAKLRFDLTTFNSVSSGATGLLLAIASGSIATLFGTDQAQPFLEVGIFLVLFSIIVFIIGNNNLPRPGSVRIIIMADTLWVVVSLVIVLFQLFDLSVVGYIVISAVASWVAVMAYLQFNGLKQATNN